MRNANNRDDLGEVVNNSDPIENCHLIDEQDIYLQILDPKYNFDFSNPKNPTNVYNILFREWDPETWKMGNLYEIAVDKNATANKLATFLVENVFPHI